MKYPTSPKESLRGILYFRRLCNKVRLHCDGELGEDYHQNLGAGMDLWTCQFLEVEYQALADQVKQGLGDEEALDWAFKQGREPSELQIEWWNSYIRNCGFGDTLAEILAQRVEESGFQDKGIQTFFEYIETDEGR